MHLKHLTHSALAYASPCIRQELARSRQSLVCYRICLTAQVYESTVLIN
jgi:hypothetical protein